MIDPKIIRNYADCLFVHVKSEKDHELVLEQISITSQILTTSAQAHFVFCAPVVSRSEKLKLIEILAKKFQFTKIVSQFLSVVTKNARFNILPHILVEYEKLLAQKKGIKAVTVEAANKPDKKELDLIKKYLENKLKKIVEFEVHQDKSLIGGVVIKYDSMLYDYSIAGAIDRAEKLAKNVVIN